MGIFDNNYGAALDPTSAGLLSAAFGALQASGPSPMPVSLGQVLGKAGQAGIGAYQSTLQNNTLLGIEKQKMALLGAQVAQAQYHNALTAWAANGGVGPAPTPPTLPGMGSAPQQPPVGVGGGDGGGPTPPGISATSLAAAGMPPELATPSAPQSQGQGLFAGLPDYVRKASIANLALPGSGAMIMDANKPIPLRQGPLVSPSGQIIFQNTPPVAGVNFNYGQGGRVTSAEPIPGFTPTVAGIEAGKAGAKASAETPYKTVEVTTPDGRKVLVPESSITGGGSVPAPAPGTTAPAASAPKPLAQGITPAEAEAQTANEKSLAEEASKGREAANLAVDTNYNLQHILESSKGFETGQFTPTVMGARAFLQGMAPGLFPEGEMKKLTTFQEFNKYSIRLGFDQARKMGARESTQIVQMSIESNPNPKMVKPAIDAIANGLIAQNDYIIAKEKARDAYLQQYKKLGGFNSQWQSIADPRAFLLARLDQASQAKMISNLSAADREKLTNSLTALRKAGVL